MHLCLLASQLLGFAILIYEVQSAPRRVLTNRTLQHILGQSVFQLVAIREEIRRVRDYGGERVERSSPKTPQRAWTPETTTYLHRMASFSDVRRVETTVSLPSLASEDEGGNWQRLRTASASSLLARSRSRVHRQSVQFADVSDVSTPRKMSKKGGKGQGASTPRSSSYGMQSILGRSPPPYASHKKHTPLNDRADPFAQEFSRYIGDGASVPLWRLQEDPRIYTSSSFLRRPETLLSPGIAESAVSSYNPASPTLPSSRRPTSPDVRNQTPLASGRSSWRANDVDTPKLMNRIITDAVTPVTCRPDVEHTPTDEHLVTPSSGSWT